MKVNDIVQYKNPFPDEVGTIYRVLETKGDSVLMEAIVNLPILPTYTAKISDLQIVAKG